MTGTVLAVQRAHENLAPGYIAIGNTTVLDGNVNRSPSPYLANPASERARYQYGQDKDTSLLRFSDANGNARGFISFFPVHGTNLYLVRKFSVGPEVLMSECSPRTTPSSVVITRGWQRTSTRARSCLPGSFVGLSSLLAFVEPNSMPGNTTFVAGFTQCKLEHRIPDA